ncbi:MAG: acyl-ACP--UDP-N-acetylglucosamine O-acyltransferase [Neomegalonema sp.]|nr:acyl-ACP--UDP-N-acetylglucosamine O-acyltransferase [Neomegalonema sp.]
MPRAQSAEIHPTAIVDEAAVIGENVRIGPYCVIDADVEIGAGVELKSHVTVSRWTQIGEGCIVWPFASLGAEPQDLKFNGEASRLIIGPNNRIREHVTMHRGTEGGGGVTRVGANGLYMVGVHIAHDAIIGDNVVLANNATVAGHVVVENFAILGGLSAVHQFCRIGAHAMVGGMSGVEKDVIPFGSVIGNRAALGGLNIIGLKRRGFDRETIQGLRRAYDLLFYSDGVLAERVAQVEATFPDVEPVQEIVRFVTADSSRSFCTPRDV